MAMDLGVVSETDTKLRSLFTVEQVYDAMGLVDPHTGRKSPVKRALKSGELVLTCTEAQLLYSAFQYENDLSDDLPKKAAIKKRFSVALEPQMAQRVDKEKGTVVETPVPGFPRRSYRFKDPSVLCFTPEQASYLETRLKEFLKVKDKEGKLLLTADAADSVVDLLGGKDEDGQEIKGLLQQWIESVRPLKKEHVEDAKVEAEVLARPE